MTRRLTLLIAILLALPGFASARSLDFGDELTIEVSDSAIGQRHVDAYSIYLPGKYMMLVKWISQANNDISKMEAKGDTIIYPPLKSATLLSSESEKWHDWTHDWRKRTYQLPDSSLAKTYQINANGYRYYVLFLPENEEGQAEVDRMIESGFNNHSWFANAPFWWSAFYMVLILCVLFFVGEDGKITLRRYAMSFIIFGSIFLIIAALVCHGQWHYWQKAAIGVVVIALLTPILRKPIIAIMEHID